MKSTQDQAPTALPGDGLVPLESILCTEELNRRPTRPRDYETENRALTSLARALAESPRSILQTLADTILEVCKAGSAGLSLLTKEDGGKRFYWPAIAGQWKPHISGGTPRDFGPCGDVLDRNVPLLFRHFERRYPYLLPVTPPAVECLLVPFYVEGKAVGTVWAITHDDRRTFDLEDLRQLVSLATFASSAYQVTESLVALDQQGETLRQSEERYRIVTQATNNAVWDWNLKTNKVWWNEGAFMLFGYRLENQEADSGWWLERIHSDDRAAVEAHFFDVVRGKELSWMDEYRFRCADGSYKDVYDQGYVLRDPEGRAVRMIGAMLDITTRKRAEQALRESEQRWRSLTEALPQLVWSATPDGACDYFSTQWTEHTGVPATDLLGWRWLETLHPDDRAPTRRLWTDSVAGRGPYDVEYRVRRSDGAYRWYKTRGTPIRDSEGNIAKWIGTCTDITDLQHIEGALRASEARFRVVVEAAPNGMVMVGPDGRIVLANVQMKKMFGYEADELIGESIERLVPQRFRERHPALRGQFFAAPEARGMGAGRDLFGCRKDGSEFPVEIGLNPIRMSDGLFVLASVIDVTERKRAEEVLRESEQRWRLILDNAHDAFVAMSPDGRIAEWNRQAEITFGWPRAEAVGRLLSETIIPPQFREAHELGLARFLATGDGPLLNRVLEVSALRRDGREFPVEVSIAPVRLGEQCLFAAFIRDVTERKQSAEAIRASNERFRMVARATNDAVWDWDMNTNKVWWNEGVFTLFGYHLDMNEASPGWWLERVHPDDRESVEVHFFDVVRGEQPSWVNEYRFCCADGSYKDVYDRGYVLRDSEGRAVRMIGAMLDITGRKRAEEALRESEGWFRFLANAMPQIVWTARPDGYNDYVNQRGEDHIGVSIGELHGDGWFSYMHPDDRDRSLARWLMSVESGVDFDVEYRLRGADGRYRWFKSRCLPIRDESGQVMKWVGTCTDMDDLKRTEEALRSAKESAEAANQAKDEFLANVSHEIRTPMNAILGMTDLALDTVLTENQRQYLTTVKSAADALLGIISDILDFAKIESGRLELDPADFSLSSVLGATLRALAVRAHKKGLELVCQQRPDVPDALIGDAGRLRQVLLNLVGNAIKFTARGEVVVLVESATEPAPEGEVRLRFVVTDTGIGIPPEKQAKIFQAFEQEDTSTTRKYGGTGLGLTIAARLVALMGGQISVESAPGWGSTFAFTALFGLQSHPPETTVASNPAVLRGMPVLIVDDNATNRQILEEWLRGYAMAPTVADDSVTAMAALWRAVAQGRPYPLALLDGRLPDVDGLALAAKIRQQSELSATRFILLTSGDCLGDPTRARQLGISATLLKPLQQRELLQAILRVMGQQGEPEVVPGNPAMVRRATSECSVRVPLRILAAEDNEFNRDLLEHMLARLGLSAAMAVNGQEALALLEREPFDLLLLDIHMPELDGFQVVHVIRERERTSGGHLPVIALTARSRKEDRARCLQVGMDDYLAKPFTAADLRAAIDRVLRRHPPRQLPRLDLLDAPVLLAACGGDPVMLRKMCRALQSRVPEYLATIRDALHDQDALRLREAAHKFYGMLSPFSTVAGSQAADLEDLAAGGMLMEAPVVVEQLDRFATELARLAEGLTVEMLRNQAEEADDPNRAASL